MHEILNNNFVNPSDGRKQKMCLCRSIYLVNIVCGVIGMNYLCSVHKDGICVYRISVPRLCWSAFISVCVIFKIYYYAEYKTLTQTFDLPILLNSVTDSVYHIHFIIGVIFSAWKARHFAKTLNDISKITKSGLLCESALITIRNLIVAFIGFLFCILIINAGILAYLHYSESYEDELSVPFIMGKMIQNGALYYYVVIFTMIAIQKGMLTCFEKLSQHALGYTEIYPMKKISGSDNKQDIFIFFTYNVCNSEHVSSTELQKLTTAEIIEHFRILHEEISEIMYSFNDCMNPSLLIIIVVEIILLVINWYSVIINMVYDFHFLGADTIFVLNVLFAVSHTVGLFVFLRNAQKLSNMVHGYSSFLMEYSTRVSTPADHLQLRIFIEKIKQHKPITASGIFTVDLGIAGPIFANILTYVLVALQFKIPQSGG